MEKENPLHEEQNIGVEWGKIGRSIEEAIIDGKEIIIAEGDRKRVREFFAENGIDLGAVQGKANLSQQADKLVEVFGKKRFMNIMPLLVIRVCENSVKSLPDMNEAEGFMNEYLGDQVEKARFVFDPNKFEGEEGKWKKTAVYRAESVLSVISKLLWIAAPEDETEGVRRQNTDGVKKHLRERVVRGAIRAGMQVSVERGDLKDEVIRHLPNGALPIILEQLMEGVGQ